METTIITTKQIVETQHEVALPYYTKKILAGGTLFSVSKVFSKDQCVYVSEDQIAITFSSIALQDGYEAATETEFLEFLSKTNANLISKIKQAA